MAKGKKTGGRQKGTPNKLTKTARENIIWRLWMRSCRACAYAKNSARNCANELEALLAGDSERQEP